MDDDQVGDEAQEDEEMVMRVDIADYRQWNDVGVNNTA